MPKAKVDTLLFNTDLDEDGISEILTGPGPDLMSKSKVRIFRKDGTLIREFQAYPDNIRFGVEVSTGRIEEELVVEAMVETVKMDQHLIWQTTRNESGFVLLLKELR